MDVYVRWCVFPGIILRCSAAAESSTPTLLRQLQGLAAQFAFFLDHLRLGR